MGDPRWYRTLVAAAVLATLAWVGWAAYDGIFASARPGDFAYHAGTNYFADQRPEMALQEYEKALAEDPDHIPAKRGRAESLIVLQREVEAIEAYEDLLLAQPENPGLYANLGIAYDRLGEHEKALEQYRAALRLDSDIGDGPGWLTRFMRNQGDKPPGIADRATYLAAQLALPEDQRLLAVPKLDGAQRPYKK